MRIFKIVSLILLLPVMAFYLSTCSSAEQTTGKLAYDRGDYEKAEAEFMKELKQNPSNEEAWFYLGAARIFLSKFDEADEAFQQYRKIGKNSYSKEIQDAWIKRFNSGADNFEKGQKTKDETEKLRLFNSSVSDFKICKIILPDSTVVNEYIASINNKIALITINPIIDKGVALYNEGKYDEALNEYKTALSKIDKKSPAYEVVGYNIAITYLRIGEQIRKNSDQDTTYKDKYREAMPFLEDLVSSKEICTQYNSYMLLVQVYANTGMTDKALDAIAKRDKLKGEHPECVKEENK